MLVIIMQAAIPVRKTNYKISALIFLVVLFLCDFKFHFGSVFKIINLD
jgi:hypothetical protein